MNRTDPRFNLSPEERIYTSEENTFLNSLDVQTDNNDSIIIYTNTKTLTEAQKELIELAHDAYYFSFSTDNDDNWFANGDMAKGL